MNENPSIISLKKVFDKNNIMHPSTYAVKFGSWENVLRLIEKDDRIKRKQPRSRLPKVDNPNITPEEANYLRTFPDGPIQTELITSILEEMKTKKLYDCKAYLANYNKDTIPHFYKVKQATGFVWQDIFKLYVERFGEPTQ